MPTLLLGHLALPELHDDVHRTDAVAYIIGEVRADPKAGTDASLTIVSDFNGTLGIEPIGEDDILNGGVDTKFTVASDDLLWDLRYRGAGW